MQRNQLPTVIIEAQLNFLHKRTSCDNVKPSLILGSNALM